MTSQHHLAKPTSLAPTATSRKRVGFLHELIYPAHYEHINSINACAVQFYNKVALGKCFIGSALHFSDQTRHCVTTTSVMHGRVKTEMQWYGTADAAPEKNKWVVSSSKTLQASHLHLDSGSLHKCIETFMLPPRTVDCWIYMSEFLFTDVFRISCI